MTVGDAMQQLHNMDDLTDGVKSLVLSLINSGDHSSEFFDQEIKRPFEITDDNLDILIQDIKALKELYNQEGGN